MLPRSFWQTLHTVPRAGVMYCTPTDRGDVLLLYQEAQPLRAAPRLHLEGSTASRELAAQPPRNPRGSSSQAMSPVD